MNRAPGVKNQKGHDVAQGRRPREFFSSSEMAALRPSCSKLNCPKLLTDFRRRRQSARARLPCRHALHWVTSFCPPAVWDIVLPSGVFGGIGVVGHVHRAGGVAYRSRHDRFAVEERSVFSRPYTRRGASTPAHD